MCAATNHLCLPSRLVATMVRQTLRARTDHSAERRELQCISIRGLEAKYGLCK